MSDKRWYTFVVPGSGVFDAWVEDDALSTGGGFIEVESLTRIDPVVDPATRQTAERVMVIAERSPFNLSLCIFWAPSEPDRVEKLSKAWSKLMVATPEDQRKEEKRRGLAHD